MRPPWRRTISWEIERPRPVPSPTGLVVKKGSKMRSMCSGAMPRPLSATAISIASSTTEVRTRTTPVPSIAWAAFTIRLRNTCSSSRRAPERRAELAVLALDLRRAAQLRGRDAQRAVQHSFGSKRSRRVGSAVGEGAHVAHDPGGALDAFERVVDHRRALVEEFGEVELRDVAAARHRRAQTSVRAARADSRRCRPAGC